VIALRQTQTLAEAIDRDDASRALHPRAANREQADRTAAPNRDRVARLDVAVLRRHPAGRKNVGEEEDLLVRKVVGDFQRRDVGERDAHVLRLAARVAAVHVRVAEESRAGVTHQRLDHPGVRIGVVAKRPLSVLAEPAAAARDREGNDDAIAGLEVRHLGADLDDFAHELVSEDVAAHHGGDVTVVEMEIGSADRGQRHAHDRVVRIENLRLRHVDDAHLGSAPPTDGFHAIFLPEGCPSVVAISPVSISIFRRRRSSCTCMAGSSPNNFVTAAPNIPAGGS
jgi:hypothetical protein